MFIPNRNREWSRGEHVFTLRTAAFIVTASKCAQITRRTTSSASGAIVAARRAITFSSNRCFSGKCAWARTSQTSAHAPRRNRKTLRPAAPQVLQLRPRREEAHPHQVLLLPLRQPPGRRQRSVRRGQRVLLQRLRQRPLRPHRPHQLQEQLRRLPRQVLLQHRRQPLLHRHRHQVRLRRPPDRRQRLQVRRHQRCQRVRVRKRLLLRHLRRQRQMQVQQQEHRGPCRRVASHRCTQPPGIMYIFFRRAVSTSIRTCHRIVFFIERTASVTRLRLMHCSLQVPMRHRKAGKLFLVSTQNVSWPI